MPSKNEILKFLKENKQSLIDDFGVKKIGLFGSYATDSQNENSDIDILVNMPSKYKNYFILKQMLENQFHRNVDLGIEKNLRLLIKDRIEKEIIYV